MNTEAIMKKHVVTCGIDDTLNTAAHLMWEHDCGVVPIVDAEGTLVGMLTDRDICMAAYTTGAPLGSLSVADSMAMNVYSCRPTDSLMEVERLMREHQVRRIPVVDGSNHLVGIVSLNDLAQHAARSGNAKEIAQTLAAVSRPRSASKEHEASKSTSSFNSISSH